MEELKRRSWTNERARSPPETGFIRRMSRERVKHEEAGEEDSCEVPKIAPDTGQEIIPVQAGAVPHVGGQDQGGAPPSGSSSIGPV